ncbi:MAG: SirB2 family protein [Sphingomonadales bacterium]|nr:SirB2 family protein [Sphingomonadales bacterium]
MIEFYPQILAVHIAAITLSGGWTALRGLGVLAGMDWPRHIAARLLGWAIDGTVLTAAAMLLTILPSGMFANHWLTVKLVFVAIYFAGAWHGLSPGPRKSRRLASLAFCMVAFGLAAGIARAHDPLGWLA